MLVVHKLHPIDPIISAYTIMIIALLSTVPDLIVEIPITTPGPVDRNANKT